MQRREVRAAARSLLFFFSCSTFLTVLIAFFAAPEESFSQTANWQNAGIGSWFTATNWSTGAVPGNGVSVVVDDGGRAQVDTGSATVGNLTIRATIAGSTVEVGAGNTLSVATLTVDAAGTLIVDATGSIFRTGEFTDDGNVVLSEGNINTGPITGTGTITKTGAGTLNFAAPLSPTMSVVVNGGTFSDSSTAMAIVTVTGFGSVFQVNAGFTLNQGATLNNAGALDNSGNVTGSVNGVDSNAGGATVINQAGGVITGGTGNAVNFVAGGTVTNSGQITAPGFASVDISGTTGSVTNTGTIHGNTAGVFLHAGGTVNNDVGGSISGNGNDGVFISGGNGTVTNSGTISGPDGVRFSGLGVAGTVINNAGGTIQGETIPGAAAVGVGTINGATLNLTNSGTISGTLGVGLDIGGTVTNNAGGTITGTLSSAIGIIGSGGAVTFSNAGTVNGNVVLGNFANAVTLLIGGTINGSLNAGSATSATLTLDGVGTTVLSQAVTGTISNFVSLTKQGAGTWTIDEDIAYTGGTTISGGTLRIGNGDAAGSIIGNVTNNSALVFDRSDAITFGGVISGSGSMTMAGSGTLTLTGTNTYTGGTTISAGTLQIGAGDTSGSFVGNVTNNSALVFNRSDAITFGGTISGTGELTKAGTGTLTLTGTNNTYSGGTVLNSGTLIVAASNALGTGTVTVNDATELQIDPRITITNPVAINNNGILSNEGTIQVSQPVRGTTAAVTISGGGTVTNAAGATIAGSGLIGIESLSGSVAISNSGTISGTEGIQLAGGGTITNSNTGTITGTSGVAIVNSGSSAKLSNAGTINGSVALGNGANTVQLFSGSRINGSLNLGTNASSSLILDGANGQLFSQAVTGTTTVGGSLMKQGAGNWTIDVALNAPVSTNILSGVLTVNGSLDSPQIAVQAGALLKGSGLIIGNVVNVGTLAPGNSPGTLTVNGNFSQGPAGTYNVQVVSAQNYSRLVVTGTAYLDGTLRLTLASGFQPTPGEKFVVLTAADGINGTFRTIASNSPINVSYAKGIVEISEPAPKPEIHFSDGTPVSTTALLADHTFYGFGSLAENNALGLVDSGSAAKPNAVSLSFDAGEFDVNGHHGETNTIPIAGGFKINDRVRLNYEIPLQYITLNGTELMQAGLTLDLPMKVVLPAADRPWSWDLTPTVAIATSGSKEIIGGAALTNVIAYRWHGITVTYGNYICSFEGDVLAENDAEFPAGVNQQIMKNGLRFDIPFRKSWLIELYGIHTQFFQSAAVSSYVTLGAELGHHFIWTVEDRKVDLGYLSVGLYTEVGNKYSSGNFRVGSAWKF